MENPEHILKEWMQAVNGGDFEGLRAPHVEKTVLIPTFANICWANPA